jgi:hypothetical protein
MQLLYHHIAAKESEFLNVSWLFHEVKNIFFMHDMTIILDHVHHLEIFQMTGLHLDLFQK